VDQGREEGERVGERAGVAVGEVLAQRGAELHARARPLLDERAGPAQDLVEVDAIHGAVELGGAEDLLGDGLDEGPQRERIARRDQVDGHAHERRAHGSALLERRRELGGVEVAQP